MTREALLLAVRRKRLVVVDAPGGAHPADYLPVLSDAYDIWAVCLAIEAEPARRRRLQAFRKVERLELVDHPDHVREAARRLVEEAGADGVFVLSERVVHEAQHAAWEAGLPANPPATLDALRDKRLQRRLLREGGVPVPRQRVLPDLQACLEATKSMMFPLVVKPAIGMGGAATMRVGAPDELIEKWKVAARLLSEDSRTSSHAAVLVAEEELIGDPRAAPSGLGDYVSVEVLHTPVGRHLLTVTDKFPLAPPFRENGCLLPSTRSAAEKEAIVAAADMAHEALGLRFGASHTEIKLTADGPRIIEVNGRVGGGQIEMLAWAAGFDLVGALARVTIGLYDEPTLAFFGASADVTLQPPEGIVRVTRALPRERLLADRRVRQVSVLARRGETLDSTNGTSSQFVRMIAAAPEQSEIVELAGEVRDSFEFEPLAEG